LRETFHRSFDLRSRQEGIRVKLWGVKDLGIASKEKRKSSGSLRTVGKSEEENGCERSGS